MKRRLFACVCTSAVAISLVSLSGCGLFQRGDEVDIVEVASFAEMMEQSKQGKGIKLTADIDCNGETIQGLYIPYFDGNGHTVSNCTVTTSDYAVPASFLGHKAQTAKNVTFDNITVTSTQASGAAIVSSGTATLIENVHVKNSKVTATQIDKNGKACYYGILFGGSYSTNSNAPLENLECVIKDSTVTGCTVEITGQKKSTADIFAGGLCGVAKEVSNCKVVGGTVKVVSKGEGSLACAGGAIGRAVGKVEKVAVDGCSVTAINESFWQGATGTTTGGDGRVGGVVAVGNENFSASKSYALATSLFGTAKAEIYAGGFGGRITKGTISECYALGTSIYVDGYLKDNMDDAVQRNLGGFAGELKNATVTSCFAYNYNSGKILDSSEFDTRCAPATGGFAGKITSSSLDKCAAAMGSTILNAYESARDDFAVDASGISGCYITTAGLSPNRHSCTVVDASFWASEAIETLGLTGEEWSYINNLPQLTLA